MSLKVTVDVNSPRTVRVREGEKNGRKWRMAEQKVWIHTKFAPYPEQYTISLPEGSPGYPVGEYLWDMEATLARAQYDAPSMNIRDGIILEPVSLARDEPADPQPTAATTTATDTTARPLVGGKPS